MQFYVDLALTFVLIYVTATVQNKFCHFLTHMHADFDWICRYMHTGVHHGFHTAVQTRLDDFRTRGGEHLSSI
jgi:hypothetical protein